MKRFNIAVPKNYTKDGVEKTTWLNLGTMTIFPAQQMPDGTIKQEALVIQLNHMPNVQARAFEIVAKEPQANIAGGQQVQQAQPVQRAGIQYPTQGQAPVQTHYVPNSTVEYPVDDINPEDIPF